MAGTKRALGLLRNRQISSAVKTTGAAVVVVVTVWAGSTPEESRDIRPENRMCTQEDSQGRGRGLYGVSGFLEGWLPRDGGHIHRGIVDFKDKSQRVGTTFCAPRKPKMDHTALCFCFMCGP